MNTPGFFAHLGNGRQMDLGQGWAGIEGLAEQAQKLEAEQFQQLLEVASLYREAFSTGAGAAVLEDLARRFLFQRVVRPGDDVHAPGIRQGQADVIQRILAMVEFANAGGGRVTGTTQQE